MLQRMNQKANVLENNTSIRNNNISKTSRNNLVLNDILIEIFLYNCAKQFFLDSYYRDSYHPHAATYINQAISSYHTHSTTYINQAITLYDFHATTYINLAIPY